MEHGFLVDSITLLAVSTVFIALFRRLKLPAVLGYLCVGIVIGPYALGWFENSAAAHLLGEIGIAFLLFSIGLEFSLPQFYSMRRILLGLGGAQVAISTLSGGLIAWWIGIPPSTAFIVGGALAMSSTAIIVKQLTDQAELSERHGNLALGILLFQDLAAVPFLVAIPILAAAGGEPLLSGLAIALAKAAFAFAIMLAIGRWALRPLFHEVAAAHSSELFTLTVLLVCLSAAWFTALLGLSLALGAFIAGMMLSETEYRHQIEVEVRPFKDVLLGLFFITIGMQLNLAELPEIWPWVALLVVGLVIGKGSLIAMLTWWYERRLDTALRTGSVLAHGGEFGFALLALALSTGLISASDSQPILAAIVVTMMIAPLIVRHNQSLPSWFDSVFNRPVPPDKAGEGDAIASAAEDKSNHVILCGFGRVGAQIAQILRRESIPYVGLDLDPHRVKSAWDDGDAVFYADATHRDILIAAGLARARAIVISFENEAAALAILAKVRPLDGEIPILVRSRDETNLQHLLAAGASEVVPETLETSLMLTVNLLLTLNIPDKQIDDCIRWVREKRHAG